MAEVQDVFLASFDAYRQNHFVPLQAQKAAKAIMECRTQSLGGHTNVCTDCGYSHQSYNSCRNRHCPKCQTVKKGAMDRQEEAGCTGGETLPCRVHHPRTAQCIGAAEPAQALRAALQGFQRDGQGAHQRPQVPWGDGGVHVHSPLLGQQHELPSPHPHGCHRRRHLT